MRTVQKEILLELQKGRVLEMKLSGGLVKERRRLL